MILTIGHSTRTWAEFEALLRAHGVGLVVDVRRFPGSRRLPWFGATALAQALTEAGIDYAYEPDLGGRRDPRPDSVNRGWRSGAFRGYADHMGTSGFEAALERLEARAAERPIALLCAEAVPWRCHRSLIADALTVRGHEVGHILGTGPPRPHRLSPHAQVDSAGRLRYPASASSGDSPGGRDG